MLAECIVSKLNIRKWPTVRSDKLTVLRLGDRVQIDASTLYQSGAGSLADLDRKPPTWSSEAWDAYNKHTGYIWCRLKDRQGYVAIGTQNQRFYFMKFIYPREIEIKLKLSLPVEITSYNDGPMMICRQGNIWICSFDSNMCKVSVIDE